MVVDLSELKSIPFDPSGMREVGDFTALYYTVLYYIMLCYTVLYCCYIIYIMMDSYYYLPFGVQMVLTVHAQRGRPSGKVRMLARLSNVATNDYDFRNSLDQDLLGMDGVSVPGGGASAFQPITAGSHRSAAAGGGGGTVSGGAASQRRGSVGVMSTAGGASVRAGSVSYGKDFEYLLASQAEEAPHELADVAVVFCTLVGIAVIDLRAVHTFAPISPSVNIACGKVIATTPVKLIFVFTL